MNYKENLKRYIEEDELYQMYKSDKRDTYIIKDFDKFCIDHCKDIDMALERIGQLEKIINKTAIRCQRLNKKEVNKWLKKADN